MTSSWLKRRRGLVIDGLLAVFVLVLGSILLQPGVFSVDESHYLLAADSFAQQGSFHIENGYERYRSPELLYFYTVVPDEVDRLGTVSTVPPYHAVLAAPFLWLFGLRGLFFLNLIGFVATAVAVRRLAARLVPEGPFSAASAGLFVTGSFGLEYALGIWPHSLSQALVAWAVLLLLGSGGSAGRRAWIPAAASGLLCGLAVGVRIQNILLLPVLVVTARWVLKSRWSHLAAHVGGWIPPLVGCSLINLHRLGTLNPLTYGTQRHLARSVPVQLANWVGDHPWVLAIAAAGGAALWWLWRKARWRGLVPGLCAGLAALLLLSGSLRALVGHWIGMAGFHLVDTVFLPADSIAMGSTSNQLGQVLYGGVLKKGLLEVAPFLVLSLLVLAARPFRRNVPRELGFLAGVGLLGLALLPLVLTTGGFCFNPRYLLELLPALFLASMFWGRQLLSSRLVLRTGILMGILLALPTVVHSGSVDEPSSGLMPMLAPLLLAAGLLVSTALWFFREDLFRGVPRLVACGLIGATLAYGILVQLGGDMARSRTVRYYAKRILEEGRETVPDGSVLLAWEARKDVFSPLKLERDVLIAGAGPPHQNVEDFIRRAAADRRIFVLQDGVPPDRWARWSRPYSLRVQERFGLRFVELLPRGDP